MVSHDWKKKQTQTTSLERNVEAKNKCFDYETLCI